MASPDYRVIELNGCQMIYSQDAGDFVPAPGSTCKGKKPSKPDYRVIERDGQRVRWDPKQQKWVDVSGKKPSPKTPEKPAEYAPTCINRKMVIWDPKKGEKGDWVPYLPSSEAEAAKLDCSGAPEEGGTGGNVEESSLWEAFWDSYWPYILIPFGGINLILGVLLLRNRIKGPKIVPEPANRRIDEDKSKKAEERPARTKREELIERAKNEKIPKEIIDGVDLDKLREIVDMKGIEREATIKLHLHVEGFDGLPTVEQMNLRDFLIEFYEEYPEMHDRSGRIGEDFVRMAEREYRTNKAYRDSILERVREERARMRRKIGR